ncbi:type II secretory pathway, component PulF [Pelotomaculum thermopropionicum SI]|uniref:Type II secretory pathway, component PulF n=1 Tax=Pelotomaculum thermopropionicum (strain DSM 13744 / JCM 10971 / SI) TaxID=370438 RepID=A5D378_PELTS|nr:type II secretory pathway, component PulF [Pelotomaculum thermopropionicum SI]
MPRFKYKVRDKSGKLHRGLIEAEGERDAAAYLMDRSYFIVHLEQLPDGNAGAMAEWTEKLFSPGVSKRNMSILCRQLATMLQAGVPLLQALHILTRQTGHKGLRDSLSVITRLLEEGRTFSEALRMFPAIYPGIMVSMAEAGEVTGRLDYALENLAGHFEREHNISEKIKSAMVYPAVLVATGIAAVSIVFILVVPSFKAMLDTLGVELPAVTRAVMSVSAFCAANWYVLPAALLLAFAVLRYFKAAGTSGRLELHLPLVGPVLRKINIARFCLTMAMSIKSGIPVLQALELSRRVVASSAIAGSLQKAEESVRNGHSIAGPILDSGVFPPLVAKMIAVGETTGDLDAMLEKTAAIYEREANESIARLLALLEPAITFVMAGFVCLLVLTVLLPVFKILESVSY